MPPPDARPASPNEVDVTVPEIDVEALDAMRASGVKIIDVREPAEYVEAHVPGAVLIPLGSVPDHVPEFQADEPVYIICKSGGRSGRAVEWLAGQGVDTVNVAGGTMAWIQAGKPAVAGTEPGQDPTA